MAEILVNIIERGCAQFNPTVMHDSSYDWKNLEGKLMNLKETTKTNNITLDGFDANDSKHTKNLVMNDKEGIVEKTSSKTNVVLAEEQLKDDKNRSTGFDKTCAESMHRHKTVEKDALMNSIMR